MPSTPMNRRRVLTAGAALTISPLAGATAQAGGTVSLYDSPEGTTPLYARAELEDFADRYLRALVAHDPTRAPFAPEAIFAENNVRLPLGSASWRTLERLGRYRHYFADPQRGEAGLIANAYENGSGCILVLRLKIENGRIAEAEQYVTRDPLGAENYEKLGAPEAVWLEMIPPQQRASHEALEAVAFMYFQALQHNDGTGIYPFRDDCMRIEHARKVVDTPHLENYGHADASIDFTTLKAKAQYQLGMMAFVSRIRDRRFLVVDTERGAVLANAVYDFDGDLRTITFASGRTWKLPAYFRTPRSNHANEAFKIINGSFRYIEMTFIETPFGMRAAWSGRKPTVTLDYWPPPVRKSVQQPTPRATLRQALELTLDALIGHCPCALPLAQGLRYTENSIPVEPGSGLWQSATAVREYRIALIDSDRGEAGWFGALDERGLFAMVALRIRVQGGLITEMETIIARPEKPAQHGQLREATFTLFVPPLAADLEPEAFQSMPQSLTRASAADRADLLAVLGQFEAACERRDAGAARLSRDAVRRVNGHPADDFTGSPMARLTSLRGRRPLVIDAVQGLALDVVLRDNAALSPDAPREFRSPWTDLHARLLKIERGEITHVEELVRRLPYGQDTGWQSSGGA